MCQRRQKSMMLVALYGELKLTGRRKPNMAAKPIAISEYPEKSKYSWNVNASAPPQAWAIVKGSPAAAASMLLGRF